MIARCMTACLERRDLLGPFEMTTYNYSRSLHCKTEQPSFGSALDDLAGDRNAKLVRARFGIMLNRNSNTLVPEPIQSAAAPIT